MFALVLNSYNRLNLVTMNSIFMEWNAFKAIEYTEMNNLKVNIDVNKCHRLSKDFLNLFGVASPFFQ